MRPLALTLLLLGTAHADIAPPSMCLAAGDPAQYDTVKIVGQDGARLRSSSIFTSDENNVIGRLAPGTKIRVQGPLHRAEGSTGIGWAVLLTDGGRSCRAYVSDSVVGNLPSSACYVPGEPLPRLPRLAGDKVDESWVTVADEGCTSGRRLALRVVGRPHYVGALTNFLTVGDICPSEMRDAGGVSGTFVHHLPVDGDVARVTYGYRVKCAITD